MGKGMMYSLTSARLPGRTFWVVSLCCGRGRGRRTTAIISYNMVPEVLLASLPR